MATQDIHAPTLGEQGESCATCGTPLAADQRYCLQCGARRAEARLPFRDILAGAAPPPTSPPPAGAPEAPQPARAGLAFLAGLLCLLVALGVGVLIGRSGDDPKAVTQAAPQVITVGGAGGGSAPAATTATPPPASSSANDGSAASPPKSSKGAKGSDKSVQDLDKSTGDDFQKKSSKLPKEVGTGGKAPPKDNKPAGGGSDFEDIG